MNAESTGIAKCSKVYYWMARLSPWGWHYNNGSVSKKMWLADLEIDIQVSLRKFYNYMLCSFKNIDMRDHFAVSEIQNDTARAKGIFGAPINSIVVICNGYLPPNTMYVGPDLFARFNKINA
jgi:hypothetical protein